MRKHLRNYLITLASLLTVAWLIPSMSFTDGLKSVLLASLVLMLANLLAKPILNLLLLPINLLTLGLFRWLTNIFLFYLMLLVVPQVNVDPYAFSGYDYKGFIIPEISLSFFWTLFLICFIMSIVSSFLYWTFKK